jgi:hypothetical protein
MPGTEDAPHPCRMTFSDPQFVSLLTSTTVSAAMIWLGLRYNRLESRTASRRCPACGRLLGARRSCACREP